MSKNHNAPQVRFKGFTDAWEQRKFGNMLDERREKTISEDEDTLLSCAIDGMFLNTELFSHFRGSSNIGYLKIKQNDLILSAQNLHLGNCNVNLRFKHGIISPAYKVYGLVNCSPLFVQAWVKQDSTKDFFLKATTEGASACRKNVVWDELYEQEIAVPSLPEQHQIGTYFRNLDALITLHQRKCDSLQKVKKAMLQKMFPKNGEIVPEIRFKGFTDAWEQRKLGRYATFRRGSFPQPYGKKEWYDGEGSQPFVQVVDVTDKMKLADNTKQKISLLAQPMSVYAEKGQVLVTLQGSIGRVAVAQYGAFVDRTVLIFQAFKSKTDAYFWSYLMRQKFVEEARRAPGGTIKTITKEALSEFEILVPTFLEQKALGKFFKSLDTLITLHQRKLETLKKVKKSMLQKMFI